MKRNIILSISVFLAALYLITYSFISFSSLLLVGWGVSTIYLLWTMIENKDTNIPIIVSLYIMAWAIFLLPRLMTHSLVLEDFIIFLVITVVAIFFTVARIKELRY